MASRRAAAQMGSAVTTPRSLLTPAPTPAPIERVLRPFREFARLESSGGLLLLGATTLALLWANSPFAAA
jgi:hypothetical protein